MALELELSPHLLKRMIDRDFSEVDLRLRMEEAVAVYENDEPGRWIVKTEQDSHPWHVIVEPDFDDKLLVVITAYQVEKT